MDRDRGSHERDRAGGRAQLREQLHAPGDRVAAGQRPADAGSSRPRAATSTRSCSTTRRARSTRPRCARRSSRCSREVGTLPHVVGRHQPVHARPGRSRSRATGAPGSRRSTTPSARICCPNNTGMPVLNAVNARPRARPPGRGRRPGDRAGRGLQRRSRDRGRRDRRADHPADHVRLADRRRDAADHGRLWPDHGRRADRARDPRHEHVERRPAAGADDRPRRGDRLRALHRHALQGELPQIRRRRALDRSRRWTPPAERCCSPGRRS